MSLWVVVPVKPLKLGKSRLIEVLSVDQRTRLSMAMLVHTLKELNKIPEVDRIAVVSQDLDILRIASKFGAQGIIEEGTLDLNTALTFATRIALGEGARGLLIVPADLPLLEAKDLRDLILESTRNNEMIIVPDFREDGTNAMLLFPPGMVEYCYGTSSFVLHSGQAKKIGMRLIVRRIRSIGLDLDLPEDLMMLMNKNQSFLIDKEEKP
jgi:2-phospho-L-lactate guanylyltransferase